MRYTHKKRKGLLAFYYFIQFIAICSSGPYIVKVKQKIIRMFILGFCSFKSTKYIGDFNMLIRLVIQMIYISWNRNIKRKIIIFNYTKFQFYVQIKHLIKDHCTDQA